MKKKITRIAITGAMGRMGQVLIKEIQKNKNTVLTAALVKNNHPLIGQNIGEKIGIGKTSVSISSDINIEKNDFDVLIDFTKPSGTFYFLEQCYEFKKNMIIGTTGFSEKEIKTINSYAKKIALIKASNFSIGINLLYQLIQKTTKILGNTSDIDIIEYHHRNKIDIPSGTALSIGENISKVMNWELNKHSLYYTKGITKKIRETKKIGFSSIRSGNIIGKHTVLFSSSDEEIKITHSAFNRESFAKGAIEAAVWIHEKKHGLFNMNDILKDKF
ncbi:4-hydroxy-tetrahydrodipicolinate reductase [Buchnera aphidicola]|jgi:4-hydroxy-tetrahydrodipicolinate reductase|uniref:4-hydroxy-tetrahydrodipicolinate reductase n=1 Tax=Buchnera aphidicola subsp. Schizaphis graminum (strain Sg) TaxID=198804 RepID=DAPB_BUCAP|nr:4-hydroxy-tetrahydrodipicolinate reductase [Buchnera aphidicola]Q8K9Z5.1 RecName: Full=4-hydroxy-tetrahydrodipicolinate reductase; Short=HTPA reductase [Buchnera aphidicola str. Sg (Schizaphis graminum)]AAM67707.1 dihydrodipicolinate reductase [Buchnera aphidicola str. Sg (Schizaphis graminum)]AWI49796.1 4-hydroxy-tetrahydrodipicolinate reductase [Buchnera aphidicola (Schizaphis graminum)]